MKRKISIILFLLCSMGLSYNSPAVTVAHLYEAKDIVKAKSSQIRKAAIQENFKKVLIKVSGNAAIASVPQIQQKLENAEQFVQRYSYKKHPQEGYWLHVSFSEHEIRELLRQANQPVWGAERPQILTWIVLNNPLHSELIYSNVDSSIPRFIYQYSTARGVPMILPMIEKDGLANIGVEDVLRSDDEKLIQAAKRYTAPVILTVQVTPSITGPWQSLWELRIDGEKLKWNTQAETLTELLHAGINNTADHLASRYAILNVNGYQSTADIRVGDVRNIDDYARVKRYLDKLSAVKKANLTAMSDTQLAYHLELNGDVFALLQAMKLNPVLVPESNNSTMIVGQGLTFRLARHDAA